MKRLIASASAICVVWYGMLPLTAAADLYVYPAKGQSQEQQATDKGACMQFATQQTGFDPMATPTATSPEPQQKGGLAKGATHVVICP